MTGIYCCYTRQAIDNMVAKASTRRFEKIFQRSFHSYLKDIDICLKSRWQGFRYFSEVYFHGVNVCVKKNYCCDSEVLPEPCDAIPNINWMPLDLLKLL